jgi:hypothetical protein
MSGRSNIEFIAPVPVEERAVTIEEYRKRKEQRRRRVAKRLFIRGGLFAVEQMQSEFPGYTPEQFEQDVMWKPKRKNKSKSFRRPKPRKFDWPWIRKEIPAFFNKCVERTPTKAVLRGRLKDGTEFSMIVRSSYFQDNRQVHFRTSDLIQLWRNDNLKAFLKHDAVQAYTYKQDFFDAQNLTPEL